MLLSNVSVLNIEESLRNEHSLLVSYLKTLEGNSIEINVIDPAAETTYINNLQVVETSEHIILKDAESKNSFKICDILSAECYGVLGAYVEINDSTYMHIALA